MLLICDGLLRVFIKVENSRFQLVAPSSKDLDIAFKGGSPLKCTVRVSKRVIEMLERSLTCFCYVIELLQQS